MPYLVSSMPPASQTNALRLAEFREFADDLVDDSINLATAMQNAEERLWADHTDVKIWEFKGSLEVTQSVKWNAYEA